MEHAGSHRIVAERSDHAEFNTGEGERAQQIHIYSNKNRIFIVNKLSNIGLKIESSDLSMSTFDASSTLVLPQRRRAWCP